MQQWMSALLDDVFVAVKKLKDKQGWLTKRGVAGRPARIHALVKRWTKTVETDGDYIEK